MPLLPTLRTQRMVGTAGMGTTVAVTIRTIKGTLVIGIIQATTAMGITTTESCIELLNEFEISPRRSFLPSETLLDLTIERDK